MVGRIIMKILVTAYLILTSFGALYSQTVQPYLVQFDKPLYTAGETVWFSVFKTDHASIDNRNEILHFELISPRNDKILQGKIDFNERLAEGYLTLPTDLQEGYFRFRAFTLRDLRDGGYYIYADIPIYSEWNENLTVFKYEDELIDEVKEDYEIILDKRSRLFNRRDTVRYANLVEDLNGEWQYSFWVSPREFEKINPIVAELKMISQTLTVNSEMSTEDSLYFEAFLGDIDTDEGVSSTMISIYSGDKQRFFRSKSKEGWFGIKLPNYRGDFTLQVFNLNPYQSTINNLKVKNWTIPEGYFNPAKPPLTQDIADYLIKAKRRRKIYDMFSGISEKSKVVHIDSVIPPDRHYVMADYRYIKDLYEFIYEAIPGARVVSLDNGSQSVRLFNPERGAIFVDKPWYIVDGYLTNREEEVLKIPFADIEEISLYVDTNTIRKHFEFFLWRNGILEVKTKDIKYLRSLKSDPNYVDFSGLQPRWGFYQSLIKSTDTNAPDFRTTMYWESGTFDSESGEITFILSDDTGRYVYNFLAVSSSGEILRRKGEFEIK